MSIMENNIDRTYHVKRFPKTHGSRRDP